MRRLIGLIVVPFGALMLLWCSPAFADPGFTHTDTTPGCRSYQVPTGAPSASVSAVGAAGGAPFAGLGDVGGSGGSVTGQIPVTGGQSLYVCVNVGGGGGDSDAGGGGGASGVALGSDFSSPLVVAGGGGGAEVASGGNAGFPAGASGGDLTGPGGGGGTATSGGSGGALGSSFYGGGGAGFTAAGPGSGGSGALYGGGGGAGYYGGGGGAGNAGGGGGSDYCDASVTGCQTALATSGPSVTIQYLAPQSIAFPATAVTYGQADFSPASSDSGLAVSYSNASGKCTISGGQLHIAGAGSCTVTADQAGDDQYAAAPSVTQTFQINPAVVHIDADAASVGYGNADPASSGTLRAGDFANGDTAATSNITGAASCSIASHAANAGTYAGAITCQPGTLTAANYTFVAGHSADLTINQAVVHVDADAASVGYGNADPASSSTLRAGDFANGDTAATSNITGAASCSIASHAANAGTYAGAITCQPGTLTAANYTFVAGHSADLTINQAVVHIDADAASVGYGNADPASSSTLRAGDFANGDTAATSNITGAASCSIASHAANAGTYAGAITCQPGTLTAANYTFVAGHSADLTINQAVVHIDADAASVGYGNADPASSSTLRAGDFANGDTAATSNITGAASCSIASHAANAGTYAGAITCQPGTLTAANYTFVAGHSADLTINQAAPPSSGSTPSAPTNGIPGTSAPTLLSVTGTAEQGKTLKVSGQKPGATYSYQWEDCNSTGGNPQPIRGATGPSYTLTRSDVGHIVRVVVTGPGGQWTPKANMTSVVLPSNRLAAPPRITAHANGTFTISVHVPGPGVVNIMETAWNKNLAPAQGGFAHTVMLLQPAPGRFVFARAHATTTHHGTLNMTVHPNKAGRELLAHHAYPITLRLWITYIPNGGRPHTIGHHGLKVQS